MLNGSRRFMAAISLLGGLIGLACCCYERRITKIVDKEYYGIARTTFVIDEDGKIIKIYEKVKPDQHAEEILKELNLVG